MDYKIISPYDAQRNAIESKMRNSPDLNWESKCFNVDSFQGQFILLIHFFVLIKKLLLGNEEDYIIVSLVRSKEIGFLKSLRRTNVMLTRFKKGMFVVTSKKFLAGPGEECLVGGIAKQVGEEGWLTMDDVTKGKFFGTRKISK
jgi:superfamily I DNA and/or RNA helicase